MKRTDFHVKAFEKGQKCSFELDLDGDANGLSLPVLLVCGRYPGKTLVATANIHGDEYEGVQAIFETYASLNVEEMKGNLLAVPVANPPAFWQGTRSSPLDNKNLARVFPGKLDGGPSAATAYGLAHSVIACADFYIDLHSSGVTLLMPTMVGYDARDPRSGTAAYAFGAPVMWGHRRIEPGRTIAFAKERGIPWLYSEARGGGRIHPDDVRVYRRGLCNLMQHLGILAGKPSPPKPRHHLFGDGNTDAALQSHKRGFLIPSVRLLQDVKKGAELGRVLNLRGEVLETIRAQRDGVVALIRAWPVVAPGVSTFLITRRLRAK